MDFTQRVSVPKTGASCVSVKGNMEAIVTDSPVQTRPDFGQGRYSALMCEIWRDAQRVLGLSSVKAETLARNISRDVGSALSGSKITIKVGNPNKDGKLSLKEMVNAVKGVTCTNAILALRALNWANEAGKFGFATGQCQFVVGDILQEYFESL